MSEIGWVGTETEWGFQVALDERATAADLPRTVDHSGQPYIPGTFVTPDSSNMPTPFVRSFIDTYAPKVITRHNQYTQNGGRLYPDHDHPETSIAPVRSLDDVVLSELADEQIMIDIGQAAIDDPESPIIGVLLNRRSVDHLGTAFGYHECHNTIRTQLSPSRAESTHLPKATVLALHFATRGIFTGSGCVRLMSVPGAEQPHYEFVTSQKLTALTKTFSHGTTEENKPLFNTRDTPYASHEYARLHVVSGDPNLNPWATKMKVGTTRILVEAMHAGYMPTELLQPHLFTLYQYAAAISRDPTGKLPLQGYHGETMNALDIQWRLYDMAYRFVQAEKGMEPGSDDYFVLTEWKQVLEDLEQYERYPNALLDRIDWVARRHVLGSFATKHNLLVTDTQGRKVPDWNHPQIINHDLLFDAVSDPKSPVHKFRNHPKFWGKWMPSAEAIKQRRTTPPNEARAQFMGRAVVALHEGERTGDSLSWSTLRPYHNEFLTDDPYRGFRMPHPGRPPEPGAEAYIRAIEAELERAA